MTNPGQNQDDPLERLAAEAQWRERMRAVEADVLRERRKSAGRQAGRMPRRRGRSRGISLIFVALVLVMLASGWSMWSGWLPGNISVFVFVMSAWLVSLTLHEFAHAFAAHRGGDDSVEGKGYLNLDLRRYGHPVLTFVLPLIFLLIGGLPLPGGAVLIERHRLRGRFWDSLVSAVGPAVNVLMAGILLTVVSIFGPTAIFDLGEPHAEFWAGLTFLAYLQVAVSLLNLLPVPGLDGYGIIEPYLPSSARRTGEKIKPWGILVIFVLLSVPLISHGFNLVGRSIMDASGAPINGVYYGYSLFQFWRFW